MNLRALLSDKTFCTFLIASFSSFGAISIGDFLRLAAKRRAQKSLGLPAAQVGAKHKEKRKRKKGDGEHVRVGLKFWADMWTLLKIFCPHPLSRGARLLAAQFFLLVMKTLVTVRCSKLCVYFLTRAIAQASWKSPLHSPAPSFRPAGTLVPRPCPSSTLHTHLRASAGTGCGGS